MPVSVLTGYAGVVGLEVGLEFLEAGSRGLHLGVGDPDGAGAAPRAQPVRDQQHVRLAAQVPQVDRHAPANIPAHVLRPTRTRASF